VENAEPNERLTRKPDRSRFSGNTANQEFTTSPDQIDNWADTPVSRLCRFPYFFNCACQLRITVKDESALELRGTGIRKRLPSAETS
jgi:hypothetical protein